MKALLAESGVDILSKDKKGRTLDWPRSGSRTSEPGFEPDLNLRFGFSGCAEPEPEPHKEVRVRNMGEPEP